MGLPGSVPRRAVAGEHASGRDGDATQHLSGICSRGLVGRAAALGVTPILRGALYGLGPVVLGIFMVALYCLGRSAAQTVSQAIIALGAAALVLSPLGVAAILLLAASSGLLPFHPRTAQTVVASVGTMVGAVAMAWWSMSVPVVTTARGALLPPGLVEVGTYFFTVGAFTVGGGLTMIAFIEDQVVHQFHWLTAQEFIDGLALGQFTPGPVLMLAAPHALPDPFAFAILIATVAALLFWRPGTIRLMIAGALLGVLRSRLLSLPGVKAARELGLSARL